MEVQKYYSPSEFVCTSCKCHCPANCSGNEIRAAERGILAECDSEGVQIEISRDRNATACLD